MLEFKSAELVKINGLVRSESVSKEDFSGIVADMTHAVYSHDALYSTFCPVHAYIDCPPLEVFEYMSNPHSLEEWTYGMRNLVPSEIPDVYVGNDLLDKDTKIYCRTVSNREALTVDYHCAWDQGEELWMIYLNRIVPAELVLKQRGAVIFWQNCRHPYYQNNPYPDKAPKGRPFWVGDFWDSFYAGHSVELHNLKLILEHRSKARGLIDSSHPEKD